MNFKGGRFIVRERVAFMKLADRYDIVDPESGRIVAYAKETISTGLKLFRLLFGKSLFPTTIILFDEESGQALYRLVKSFSFIRSRVSVQDAGGREIGYFVSRFFSIGGRLDVFSSNGKKMADLKGNWTGWEFAFASGSGVELGRVSRRWGGFARELFTSADDYLVLVREDLRNDTDLSALILMAALAVDVIYKEKK